MGNTTCKKCNINITYYSKYNIERRNCRVHNLIKKNKKFICTDCNLNNRVKGDCFNNYCHHQFESNSNKILNFIFCKQLY